MVDAMCIVTNIKKHKGDKYHDKHKHSTRNSRKLY